MILRRIILACLLAGMMLPAWSQYCLSHINIVDVAHGGVLSDQTVCITGGLIASISSSPPPSGQVYDCRDKFLIPGLWDMHIHDGGDDSSNRYEYVPLFLANGVTGIRDMWGSADMLRLKADIAEGKFLGPRMVVGSPIIEGDKPFFGGSLHATSEALGRFLVDSLSNAGYDFIKVYSLIRDTVYLSIADECRKKGIPLEGHLPIEIGLEQALDAGQRSFEHNFCINRYLTGREASSIVWAHQYLDTVRSTRDAQFMVHTEPLGVSLADFHISPTVLQKMISARAAVVPTLTLAQGRGIGGAYMASHTRGLEYFTAGTVAYWTRQTPAFPKDFIQTFGEAAKFLADKGVLILAGTDVNNPFCMPGFGLQQELVNLHEAGLTNLQVLQAATLNPARFLYKESSLGTVSVGKVADLLVLDDNPLADISNTQKIFAVIANGHYISKEDIQKMLSAQRKR
jgi:imidazolonepropionase-like amidohydrolase